MRKGIILLLVITAVVLPLLNGCMSTDGQVVVQAYSPDTYALTVAVDGVATVYIEQGSKQVVVPYVPNTLMVSISGTSGTVAVKVIQPGMVTPMGANNLAVDKAVRWTGAYNEHWIF